MLVYDDKIRHTCLVFTGGSTHQVSCQFSRIRKKIGQSSTSSITFPAQTCTSNLPPPQLQWRSTPPPLVCTQDPLLCMGINEKADVVACRLPRGVPLRWPIFKFCPPGSPLACKLIKMKNHGIFCLCQQITLPHDKYWGEIPSAMQIPSPIPFCRLPPMGVWAHGSSATDACIIDSSSAGIAGRWEPTM
jgi:hypothetical protein